MIETDICIVGAGAAGIALAHKLVGSGIRMCLLESGGFEPSWEVQSLAVGDSIGLRYSDLDSCQIRYFGGNTNGWGGWCRPLDDIDFQHRPWVEDSGWPFGLGELAPYYRAAHELCQVLTSDYEVRSAVDRLKGAKDQLLSFDGTRLETILYRFSPPTRFGQAYRKAINDAQNIKCLINAHALRIRTTADGRMARRVAVGCLCGLRFEVAARIFVLAAGAIENARLLLVSNDEVANGLGNQHDVVGRYLMDHPHTRRILARGDRAPPLGLYGLAFKDRGISAGLSLPAAVQMQEKILNYNASIYQIYAGQMSDGWRSFMTLALSRHAKWRWDPYDRLSLPFQKRRASVRHIAGVIRQLDKVAIAAILQLLRPARFGSTFVLESRPEQAPNPESRVTLSRERDAFGLNRACVDWRILPIDERTVDRAEQIVDAELRRLGVGYLAPHPASDPERRSAHLIGGWHQIGTTRAHRTPRQGVVDANCRVHGMSNLFVTGASVFPTGGAVSPTPTILALALRLADHLVRCLRERLVRAGTTVT